MRTIVCLRGGTPLDKLVEAMGLASISTCQLPWLAGSDLLLGRSCPRKWCNSSRLWALSLPFS